jgi:PLP dependent protein
MIAERLHDIELRISAACRRAGRSRSEVTMVAVTKTLPADVINEAIRAGVAVIGENRVQEYLLKREALLPHAFHLIGHLQRNKVKSILPYCTMIHSVDSARLAEEIQMQAKALSRTVDLLLEVNVSGEESKFGLRPEETARVLENLRGMDCLRIRGLMTVAAFTEDPEEARPEFQSLNALLHRLRTEFPESDLRELSMGMTNDFEVAIEEGATIIRLGTALFGPRFN